MTTSIKLNALVTASSGRVTSGTRVFFEAFPTPDTGSAYVWPASALRTFTMTGSH